MAKAIYICARKKLPPSICSRITAICDALTPDNIVPEPPRVYQDGKTAFAVLNPNRLMQERHNSLLLGALFGDFEHWHRPNSSLPDGCYALFRENETHLEIVSDPSGSRTIWYYMDDEQFVASTSQQAIIMYLGSFDFDPAVIPWILSTTGLGPDHSWDKRINLLRADSSVLLNKRAWAIKKRAVPIEFVPQQKSDKTHKRELLDTLYTTFESLNIDFSRWALSLSGGYDSRSILAILKSQRNELDNINSVTWGTKAALSQKDSDAAIAQRIADHYGIDHQYFILDESFKSDREIIDRFLLCGEGRVDHLAGYLDGFDLWRTLYEQNIKGIIRGDEGFGLKVTAISSQLTVRLSVKLALCRDFSNLKEYEQYGIPRQELPDHLRQRQGESLSTWRDRLFHTYKLPIIVAALSDLKSPYLDQVSPLLSRQILTKMRGLPDHLRDEKILFRNVVDMLGPDVPIAKRSASMRTREAIQRIDLMHLIETELRTEHARTVLPVDFVERALHQFLAVRDSTTQRSTLGVLLGLTQRLRQVGSQLTPRPLKNALAGKIITHHLDVTVLAWRLFVISRMTARLQQAAKMGARNKASLESNTQRSKIASPLAQNSK